MNAILYLIPLFLIGLATIYFIPALKPKLFLLLSWKKSLLLGAIYLGLLLLLYPVLGLFSDKNFIKTDSNRNSDLAASQNLIDSLYNNYIPTERELSKFEGIYKNSSHTFTLDSDKLSLDIQASPGSRHVFLERKRVDDGTINVATYVTAQYIGAINFTKQISPPNFQLQHERLSLVPPGYQTLNYKQLNVDFTIDQFKKVNSSLHGMSTNFGGQLIYIRVPKSLTINSGKYTDQIQVISSY